MKSRQQFSPLCDVHHTSMQRLMLEEDTNAVRSYHACQRRGCTRIFRDSAGYADNVGGRFDESRAAAARRCPVCDAILYLAEVDHAQKLEIWECPGNSCDYADQSRSPAAQ